MTHSIGIIGLGMIGESMLAEFLDHPEFTVVACWDLNPEICSQIRTRYPAVPVVSSSEEVIEHADTEMIYIATPPMTHVDYGIQVFGQKKALLMEKPLALDLYEGKRLVELAAQTGLPNTMNFGYAAGPVVETLEKIVANREVGQVLSIEIRYEFPSWPLPNQLSAASWITNKFTGGMVREMFSHHVYLIHRLFGHLKVNMSWLSYPETENSAEAFALASLQAGEIPVWFMGGIGSLKTPRNSNFTINGKEGVVRISEKQQLYSGQAGEWVPYQMEKTQTASQARLDQIAQMLNGKPTTLPTIQDGYEVQSVIEDLLAKAGKSD